MPQSLATFAGRPLTIDPSNLAQFAGTPLTPEEQAAMEAQAQAAQAQRPAWQQKVDAGLLGTTNAVLGALGLPPLAGEPSNVHGLAQVLAVAVPLLPGGKLSGAALGDLASTLKVGGQTGEYALRAATVKRLRDLYEYGQTLPRAEWQGALSNELVQAFGGDKDAALRYARMWGAVSPGTSVPVSTKESISALLHTLDNPSVPLTNELARELPDMKITMAGSKVPNINRALAGEALSGDKVEAMAGFMAGQPRIPIDVHALYALGSKAEKFDQELPALRALMTKAEGLPPRGGLTNTDLYLRYEDAMKRALQDFAPDKTINDIFATTWEGARGHKGLKPQGGPLDILRKKGLLDFGAMLDPDRLRATLKTAGWTVPAIAALINATHGAPDASGSDGLDTILQRFGLSHLTGGSQ